MNLKKIIFLIILFFPLSACVQTTAWLGPGVTIVTSGNVVQAGVQYGTNKVIKEQTGKDTLTLIKDTINDDKKKEVKNSPNKYNEKKFHENFIKLVENNFYKTRSKINYN